MNEKTSNDKNSTILNYAIDEAKTEYGEIFRDGFFGSFLVQRTVKLSGNFSVTVQGSESPPTNAEAFEISKSDTVRYDEVKNLENPAYPFTRGELPPEPFFSSLFEPIVAIGTAAAAVILFFTVRSK